MQKSLDQKAQVACIKNPHSLLKSGDSNGRRVANYFLQHFEDADQWQEPLTEHKSKPNQVLKPRSIALREWFRKECVCKTVKLKAIQLNVQRVYRF